MPPQGVQCDNVSDRSQVRVRFSRCRLVINMYCKQYRHNIRCEGFVLRTIIFIHPFRMVFLFSLAPLAAPSPCDIGREPPVCGCYLAHCSPRPADDEGRRWAGRNTEQWTPLQGVHYDNVSDRSQVSSPV